MPAQEFSKRMRDNIRAMFEWPAEIGRGKRVIHDQGNTRFMGNIRNSL